MVEIWKMERSVLVHFELHARPVSFTGGKDELIQAIRTAFSDVLAADDKVFLQIHDESWGVFIDLLSQDIPERSVLKMIIEKVRYIFLYVLNYVF